MKAFLRVFYIAIVAIVVFTGALYIAEGLRTHGGARAAGQAEAVAPRPDFPDSGEGSAL